MKDRSKLKKWIARVFIAIVLLLNLTCALEFVLRPALYVGSYELSGEVGRAVIVGIGILFLMWQVPYFFALIDPVRFRISLFQAILMQAIGVIGESWLLGTLSAERVVLRHSMTRFVMFDGGGLVLLLLAAIVTGFSLRSFQKEEE